MQLDVLQVGLAVQIVASLNFYILARILFIVDKCMFVVISISLLRNNHFKIGKPN